MGKHPIWVVLGVLFSLSLSSQTYRQVTGKVLDQASGHPLPYAIIQETETGRSTLTNDRGEFQFNIDLETDSLKVSYLGYFPQWVSTGMDQGPVIVRLKEQKQVLMEVLVRPPSSDALIDLLQKVRRNRLLTEDSSQCYYELKTKVNDQQVELVEGYYNGYFTGYDIRSLKLKGGRIGWRPFGDRFFASLESSRALALLKMTGNNPYFPNSPLEMNKRRLERSFVLSAKSAFNNEAGDSILILRFAPKDTTGSAFEGEYTINVTRYEVEQARLRAPHAREHPFLPLFPDDTIQSVDLEITRNYRREAGILVFSHTEMQYRIQYQNRNGTHYEATTQAVLYGFDRSQTFFTPRYRYLSPRLTDYQRVQLIPFDQGFWQEQSSVRLVDRKKANQVFMDHPATISSESIFKDAIQGERLYEFPYIHWSETSRVGIREIEKVEDPPQTRGLVRPKQYNIGCGILLDAFPSTRGILPRTYTITDPYSTFYSGEVDSLFLCAINIYIDLVEMERRQLQERIEDHPLDGTLILEEYHRSVDRVDRIRKDYFNFVELGKNRKVLEEWNQMVLEGLGIDNMAYFRIPRLE